MQRIDDANNADFQTRHANFLQEETEETERSQVKTPFPLFSPVHKNGQMQRITDGIWLPCVVAVRNADFQTRPANF